MNIPAMNRVTYVLAGGCLVLSGFSALAYQMVWMRQFALVFGTAHVAVAAVLAAYMAGLALGAHVGGRWAARFARPLRAYGFMEACIALFALSVPLWLSLAGLGLTALLGAAPDIPASAGVAQPAFYLLAAFLILMIPTALMGATLPLLTRAAIDTEASIGSRLGTLYACNTLGAVVGALACGFVLIARFGLFGTTLIAIAGNVLAFALAVGLWRRSDMAAPAPTLVRRAAHLPLLLAAVAGASSFLLEVLWTRLLTHLFGGTTQAFALMLATFLLGIALGGYAAGQAARNARVAAVAFAATQTLAAVCAVGTYLGLDLLGTPQTETGKALLAAALMLPATLFIGATIPFLVRATATDAAETPAATGAVYAWNTLGAIAGALSGAFVALPLLGFDGTLKAAAALSLIAAAAACALLVKSPKLAAAPVVALLLIALAPLSPTPLLLGASAVDGAEAGARVFFAVGRAATVQVHDRDGLFYMRTDGLPEAVIPRAGAVPRRQDQMWLTGLPVLARPQAQSMLLIGVGGAVALASTPPSVRAVDAVELEPEVLAANRAIAARRGADPLSDARVRVVLNDARNALNRTEKRYDIIVSQPSHPWTGGSAHLYTAEFFALARSRLSAGGVLLQWVNTEFIDETLLRSLAATLSAAFADVRVYQPAPRVLLWLASDAPIAPEAVFEMGHGGVNAATFARMGILAVEDLWATLVLNRDGVRALGDGALLNTDDKNALAVLSKPRGIGLTPAQLDTLTAPLDPLNAGAVLNGTDLGYLALRMVAVDGGARARRLAAARPEPGARDTITGLALAAYGMSDQAEAALLRATALAPGRQDASFALIRNALGDLAAGRAGALAEQAAARLTGSAAAVVDGWARGASGDWRALMALEPRLAAAKPTDTWYPQALKLRVDWRLALAAQTGDAAPAVEALTLLDAALASYVNLDLLMQRAGAALLSNNRNVFVETAWEVAAQAEVERGRGALSALTQKRVTGLAAELGSVVLPEDSARVDAVRARLERVLAD